MWRVTCARTQAFWWRSSSLSVSCPSLGSTLIAVAHARLWSSFRRRSESPLLAHRETKREEKVPFLFGSCRLFPGLPPSQLWCANPFRLCSRRQPQSSPCNPTEAQASAPSPSPPRRVSRQTSRAGECCSAPSLCAGISPLFPLCPIVAVGSALIAVARARLWSSFRRCSESPLLAHQETKREEKVSCLFGSCRLFPGLPPGELWCTNPFRLCSRRQPQSSPCDPTEARALAPSPRLPRQVSRQASWAGECCSAPSLCARVSPLCPPHPCGCTLLRGSEAPPSATRSLRPRRGFPVHGNLSSFTAPSHWCRSRPYSFVSVISFFFCPTQVRGEFLAFWEV